MDKKTKQRVLVATSAISGGFVLLAVLIVLASLSPKITGGRENVASTTREEHVASPFDHLDVEAKAAYVVDLSTGEVLYAKNENSQLPLASLTKLMSSLVVASTLASDSQTTLSEKSVSVEGNHGLRAGETFSISHLLSYALTASSNSAMQALAEAALAKNPQTPRFSDLMNQEAQKLGLTQTYFINETGLDQSTTVSGGYGSAQDVSKLLKTIVERHGDLLEPTSKDSVTIEGEIGGMSLSHTAKNTDEALGNIPGFIAGKTGFTDLAGGNLAIAFDIGLHHPIIAVVLGSSVDGRFSDMIKIVQTARLLVSSS